MSGAPAFLAYEVTTSVLDLTPALAVLVLFRWDVWEPSRHRILGGYLAAIGFLSLWPPPAGLLIGPFFAVVGGIAVLAARP